MSSRKPENTKSKSRRKKLTLSKETLKDLSARKASVKGGRPYNSVNKCPSDEADCSF